MQIEAKGAFISLFKGTSAAPLLVETDSENV